MLIWLPLEKLEIRYTADWASWFPSQFSKDKIEFITVEGEPLTSGIEIGYVLDAYGTNFWKMHQMANLIKLLHNGTVTSKDILLVADAWFPGIEALEYIACLGGQRPKITGILHAGTYDSADFTYRTGMRPWGHQLEECWLDFLDLIFVATDYHRNLILQNHRVDPDRIAVTGLPFYPDEFTESRKNVQKTDLIVFPHRLDEEKHPGEFIDLMKKLNLNALLTAEHFDTKSNYYDQLAEASIAISMATQETFGYAMLEATALGCVPLVPDRLSYRELYWDIFRYKTFTELEDKIHKVRSNLTWYQERTAELATWHRQQFTESISKMAYTALTRFAK